jgi:iron uptake system component EfeO
LLKRRRKSPILRLRGDQRSKGNFVKAAAIAVVAVLLAHLAIACGTGSKLLEDSPQSRTAFAAYRAYLDGKSALLIRAVQAMFAEVKDGDVGRAGSRYERARVRYGEVEPYALTFAKLHARIDAQADEVPASEFRGFHRIERAIWVNESVTGITPVTRQLLADAKELKRRFETTELTAGRIAEGANDALVNLSTSTLAGMEEQRYARADLVDVAANVEGVDAAFKAVKPLLAEDEKLPVEVESAIGKLYATIGEYGTLAREADQPRDLSPGVSFVLSTELPTSEIDKIRTQVDALAELFAEVTNRISR